MATQAPEGSTMVKLCPGLHFGLAVRLQPAAPGKTASFSGVSAAGAISARDLEWPGRFVPNPLTHHPSLARACFLCTERYA